jgi:hypothetical protein
VNTTTSTAAQAYLDRLRRELADLPPGEVEEIVQDLEPQVAALAAELDAEPSLGTVDDHLGDPAAYARELRSAMGLAVDGDTPARTPAWVTRTTLWIVAVTTIAAAAGGFLTGQVMSNDPRPVLWLVVFGLFASWFVFGRRRSAAAEIGELPEFRQVRTRLAAAEEWLPVAAYVTSLRPGWFLAKAALTALGMVWLCHWFGWYPPMIPAVLATGAAVGTLVVSHRSRTDRRYLWLSLPLAGWAVGVAVKAAELLLPHVVAGAYYY